MPEFNPTQYAVPLFVVAVLAEMIWAKFRAPEAYEPKDTLVSLAFGLGSTVAGALLGGLVIPAFGVSSLGYVAAGVALLAMLCVPGVARLQARAEHMAVQPG